MLWVNPEDKPHESHQMTEWHLEIRSPGSTPRFYAVRTCEYCGAEEGGHVTGHYMDEELVKKCCGRGHITLRGPCHVVGRS